MDGTDPGRESGVNVGVCDLDVAGDWGTEPGNDDDPETIQTDSAKVKYNQLTNKCDDRHQLLLVN